LNASGNNIPVIQDIKTKVYGAKKGNLEDPNRLGNVMYTRGVVYGMIVVEALRVAQAKYGKGKVMTPEQLRWAFEHLYPTEARIKEIGAAGLFPPIKTSCADHEGSGMVKFQQWTGDGFQQVTPVIGRDPQVETSGADHEGSGMVKFQQWTGNGFKQVTPFMAGDREMVRKMVEETAAK